MRISSEHVTAVRLEKSFVMKFFLLILSVFLLTPMCAMAAGSNAVHVALIFDDGPFPAHAPKLLALFEKEKVHVTFGSVASNVQSNAATAKAVLAAGHEIANHSISHRHPKDLDDATLDNEIGGAQKIIADATGYTPKFYWPPFVERDARVFAAAAKAHVEVYVPKKLVVSMDYDRSVGADEIRRKATTGVEDGTVILCHEWRDETLEQLPAIIAELRRQGCVFVTFTEMAAYLGVRQPKQ
jgi:peptidoglycan/xylan/chitin deacetylase (PgdA/CDA1 family)